ncbi:MAG: 3-phosphoshikimate 1-carboxyvinyltransferase [Paludibacteraceae bacterium]|nr:3-phosphoshikimate 1-carboxyvinyltransferase [Paludibacteraceae bacterium]
MICTSIQNKSFEEISTILDSGMTEMAEIRLDLCPQLTDADIDRLFSRSDVTLLATCRIGGDVTAAEAERKLIRAVEAGAAFVDLEIEAPIPTGERIRAKALECGCRFVRSVHYYDGTPQFSQLAEVANECVHLGADVVKVVTYAHSDDDVERVMRLYEGEHNGRLSAFCMGASGKESRMEALSHGAPFTYAALNADERTADGQWTADDMRYSLYGSISLWRNSCARVPASKSMAQRAIIAATLAEGTSVLRNYTPCSDSESAIKVARALGAEIIQEGTTLRITGIGASPAIPEEISTGESGFLTRMTIPIISMLHKSRTLIKGEGTLINRPLLMAKETMEMFGVALDNTSVPLHIEGSLCAGKATVQGSGGSQLISGLMAALPLADSASEITIEEPRSVPYLHLTKDVLKRFGVNVDIEEAGERIIIKIAGGQTYKAADVTIEGDWSGAAPMLIAGAVYGSVTVPDLSTASQQADMAVLDILHSAGATVRVAGSSVSTAKSPLHSFHADLNQAPDLFPVVAILAAMSEGESMLEGVGRLASKESDRASAIMEMFDGLGVEAHIENDTMVVKGMSLSHRCAAGVRLKGGKFTSHHDHRMVMALMLAELGASDSIEIDDVACVAKSFPGFNLMEN